MHLDLPIAAYFLDEIELPKEWQKSIQRRNLPEESVVCLALHDGKESLSVLQRRVRNTLPRHPILLLLPEHGGASFSEALSCGFESVISLKEATSDEFFRALKPIADWITHQRVIEEAAAQQQHSAKLAAIGEMAGGIAHEINTPLGAILLSVDCLSDLLHGKTPDIEATYPILETLEKTVHNISRIVKSLRSFSRSDSKSPYLDTSLRSLTEDVMSLCRERFNAKSVDLRVDLDSLDGISFQAKEAEIGQVLLNLLNNSRDAVEDMEERWVSLKAKTLRDHVEIRITDSGHGISKEVAERIFQPFFTTKDVGKGTGLGLPLAKSIVEHHHQGKLTIDMAEPHTTFVIQLPLIQNKDLSQKLGA